MKIEIYTDGSCSLNNKTDESINGKGGWGVVVVEPPLPDLEYSGCFKNTTNNRMEMYAMLKALEIAEENIKIGYEAYIYADSSYIVNCINQKWYKKWQTNGWRTANRMPVKNVDLWQKIIHIYRILPEEKINIIKVEGHSGNEKNERADYLANLWRNESDENLIVDKKQSNRNY